ncbi:ABC transporter ATP-binding protein [Streptomyces sp. NPDC026206]|uniref:ABC transporter ATP-binding protein n=1 Tax=Streptomyces sp. NPDC026206 TaxID=3157089 RepID=UPI0033D5CAA2
MAWRIDARCVVAMLVVQLVAGVSASVVLTCVARGMEPLLGAGPALERIQQALPPLVVAAMAAGCARIAYAGARWAEGRLMPRLVTSADMALVQAMCTVELTAFRDPAFADDLQTAENGAIHVDRMLYEAQRFMSLFMRLTSAAGTLAVLHPLLLPAVLLAVLPAAVGSAAEARLEHHAHHATSSSRNVKAMMRRHLTTAQHAEEVRANSMRDPLADWYQAVSERIDTTVVAVAPRLLRVNLLSAAAGGVCLAGTWTLLAWLTVSGRVPLAVSATAVIAVRSCLTWLSKVVEFATSLFQSALYLDDWRRFVGKARFLAPRRGLLKAPARPQRIHLDHVTSSYPGKSHPAVEGVSVTFNRGEIVAIVGENGSGKSTLTRLITGLHTADKGAVCWDNVDLAQADPDTVWQHTGIVTQSFAHWPLTVRENITLGHRTDEHHDDRIWTTLQRVGLHDVVECLPHGLDTLLSGQLWDGSDLSGGQWQRLACARALHRQPAVLVLDEPTSEMDPRAERLILQELRSTRADRITIIVTHRLNNAKVADRIIVMRDGHIAEEGTYHQLSSSGGPFNDLRTHERAR